MDKNAIKKFAVWARRELIKRVSAKAQQYGIEENDIVDAGADSVHGKVLSATEKRQRAALIERIHNSDYQQVMEEVAYTWFNRFVALRFMEVNGYLPSHVRVFTDEENNFKPQIITEAIHLEMDDLDMEKVYTLKDANDDDDLFKYLVIVQCNALSPILPKMFQRISDYTELLFPDNLLRDGSVIEQMIAMIPEEDWKDAVQIIGWLYQYYNTEPKDETFALLKKNVKITKERIPSATQLFTPDWIVRYMVENSLGRLWVEGHPNAGLQSSWKYYLEEAEQEPEVQAQLAEIRREYASINPEDIKVIDPCMGSGHILVYCFDVLMQIYESQGYTQRDAAQCILTKNLFGLDIDKRATQLSYFAVMMKARQYDRRVFTRGIDPHVYAIQESNGINRAHLKYLGWNMAEAEKAKARSQLNTLLKEMEDAKEYGSILNISQQDWELLYRFVGACDFSGQMDLDAMGLEETQQELFALVQQGAVMAQKYDVVVTNPPYMGASGMSPRLSQFVKDNYPDTKSDMSTVCMEKTIQMCDEHGYMAMINIPVWMFLSSYEKLRQNIIAKNTITNMVHPGRGIFGSDFGTTSFVIAKRAISGYKGVYRRLFDKQGEVEGIEAREQAFLSGKGRYVAQQSNFSKIPGAPVAYWVSDNLRATYSNPPVGNVIVPRHGLATSDNNRFLKLWHEVCIQKTSILTRCDFSKKWFPMNKGGTFRKWYGNLDWVINYENDGQEIKALAVELYKSSSRTIQNTQFYFLEGITWSALTSGALSFRWTDVGAIFGSGAHCAFAVDKDDLLYGLALLNGKVSSLYLSIMSPTLNTNVDDIRATPLIIEDKGNVISIVRKCIEVSKSDWDAFETSWDFLVHPLVLAAEVPDFDGGHKATLADSYAKWEALCEKRFNQLKANEEELNRIFIDIYGLRDELTPEVEDKDVTVRKADLGRDIRSLLSYAVGCMVGRYSLDVDGLAYAGGEWDDSKYITFPVDKDNIIPICDDEYFSDDIVGRFVRFIEVVYGKDTLNENLQFIADALGGSGQPKDVIRKYFMDEFYADHLKTYQKRPIYWLFDSGKKGGFRALVYMHRYQPDTIARMRTDYVHEQQSRYRTAIADLEQRIATASKSEQIKLKKQLAHIQDQAAEIQTYEEKIHHLADQYIAIELDDGVKKNYAIFGDVLAKIK